MDSSHVLYNTQEINIITKKQVESRLVSKKGPPQSRQGTANRLVRLLLMSLPVDVGSDRTIVKNIFSRVKLAVQNLETLASTSDDDGEETVAENVSCALYEKLYNTVVTNHGNGDKIMGFHMRLLNGSVIVYEIPSQLHEMIRGEFGGFVARTDVTYSIKGTGSTRFQYEGSQLEPDCSYHNKMIPRGDRDLDACGNFLVVEVGRTETLQSLHQVAQVYLRSPATRVVVTIKVSADSSTIICCMYHVDGPRDDTGRVIPSRAISFGTMLHENTERAVLDVTGVRPEDFTGFGRHGNTVPCDAPGMDRYLMEISADDVWFRVPLHLQPQGVERHSVVIDCFSLRDDLPGS